MSAAGLSRSPRAVAIIASGVAAMGILAVLAVRADSEAPQANPWLTAMDVAVGLAFVAAGAAAGGPLPERVLVAAAGPAWLAGSFLPAARSLHQLVLAVAVAVAGTWAVRVDHPRASTGLAVGAVGSLLPLWAAWSWLPGPVRAGVLAAAPLAVAGTAQVALGWPPQASASARRAGRAVVVLAGTASLAHLLGYNPFADPGCARTCDDVRPILDSVTVRVEVHAGSRTTGAAAFSEVADRVGALGGRFTLSSTPEDETVVTAVIPCAS